MLFHTAQNGSLYTLFYYN